MCLIQKGTDLLFEVISRVMERNNVIPGCYRIIQVDSHST